jgi:hypothetical protein
MKCIHHGPTKQTGRRGSGGVGILLSERAVQDWTIGGQYVVRGGGLYWRNNKVILVKLSTLKSNSYSKTNLQLVSAYFPDSRKTQDEFQEYIDKVENTVKSVPKTTLLLLVLV